MIDGLIRWSLGHRRSSSPWRRPSSCGAAGPRRACRSTCCPISRRRRSPSWPKRPGWIRWRSNRWSRFPIESALNGAAGVRRVRSATAVGVAVVWVEFDWGQDIDRARQTVTEKLTLVSGSLPPGVEPPFLAPVSSIMGEVLFVDLESDRHSPLELRTTAETVVRRRLLAVPGVSQVIATGGEQKQYEVVLDPARLAAHQVTLDDVEARVDRGQPERDGGLSGRARARNTWSAASGVSATSTRSRAVGVKTTDAAAGAGARCRSRARRRGDQARRRLAQREAGRDHRHPEAARRRTRWS